MKFWKDLVESYKDNQGFNLLAVCASIVFVMITIDFVKAEFLGLPFSERMLDTLDHLMYVCLVGAAGVGGVGAIARSRVPDYVNRMRAKRKSNQPEFENPPQVPETTKPPRDFNILAQVARKYIGVKEIPGPQHNSTIMGWIKQLGWTTKYPYFDSDEDYWCSLFMNACALEAGLPISDSPAVKSFLTIGRTITPEEIYELQRSATKEYGIVAIFHRGAITPNPLTGSGHGVIVEFLYPSGNYSAIGGNESDQVKESSRSIDDPMFIEFRLLEKP